MKYWTYLLIGSVTLGLVGLLIFCNAKNKQTRIKDEEEQSTTAIVTLTDFTQDFLDLYLNDENNLDNDEHKSDILIITRSDSLYFQFSVEFDICKYSSYGDNFVGENLYKDNKISVFGDYESLFYSVKGKSTPKKPKKGLGDICDPNVWIFTLHKDLSFCKMKTFKWIGNEDISKIQNLAGKYFKISPNIHEDEVHKNEYFSRYDGIENAAKFALGENSLKRLISSNLKKLEPISEKTQRKGATFITILVDKNGKASLYGIQKPSSSTEFDDEALRFAELLCKYKFIPASHRGQAINSAIEVVFTEDSIQLQ